MKFLKITPSSQIYPVEISSDFKLEDWYRKIGCDTIDIVNPKHLPNNMSFVVDDEFLYKEGLKFNFLASVLYGYLEHHQPILGNVLVGIDVETEDGIETIGFDEKDCCAVIEMIIDTAVKISQKYAVVAN